MRSCVPVTPCSRLWPGRCWGLSGQGFGPPAAGWALQGPASRRQPRSPWRPPRSQGGRSLLAALKPQGLRTPVGPHVSNPSPPWPPQELPVSPCGQCSSSRWVSCLDPPLPHARPLPPHLRRAGPGGPGCPNLVTTLGHPQGAGRTECVRLSSACGGSGFSERELPPRRLILVETVN